MSTQIKDLEQALGESLFSRSGRRLVLTDVGQVVYRYADEIFSIGKELVEMLAGQPVGQALRLVVGVADVLPKLVAHRLIEPATTLEEPVRLVCRETGLQSLLGDLATHRVDVVLPDAPIPPSIKIRAFNHLLHECGVTFMASSRLAPRYRSRFPGSLDGAPVLLPTEGTTLRGGGTSRGIRHRTCEKQYLVAVQGPQALTRTDRDLSSGPRNVGPVVL